MSIIVRDPLGVVTPVNARFVRVVASQIQVVGISSGLGGGSRMYYHHDHDAKAEYSGSFLCSRHASTYVRNVTVVTPNLG